MDYWKQAHNCNIAKQKGKKMKNKKISLNLVYVGFYI